MTATRGPENNRFGWWFSLKEPYPRGQLSALHMLYECDPGAWSRVFNQPNLAKFDEPTVTGVDYPSLGVCEAWNDAESGDLRTTTYAATPSKRGASTTFRVTKLPDARAVRVRRDGADEPRWPAVGADTIEIDCEIGDYRFEIATRGPARDDATDRNDRSSIAAATTSCVRACFTGVHGNYLKPSIRAGGLDPDLLPESDPSRTNFGGGEGAKNAWKDIWGCGKGISAVKAVVPAGELVARLKLEPLRHLQIAVAEA